MDKKFLFVLSLSFLSVWFVQQYFHKPEDSKGQVPAQVAPGQAYKVPSQQELSQPLKREIDFIDKKITKKEETVEVETDIYSVTLSNYGAVISSLDFKEYRGEFKKPLKTLRNINFYEKEQAVFLLALQEKTPYFYDFIAKKEFDDKFVVSYQTQADGWLIRKNYSFFKKTHEMDLELIFEKKSKGSLSYLRPRLFFAAPFITEIKDNTQIGFYADENGKIHDTTKEQLADEAWVAPPIFGGQDKYFAHCLIEDKEFFVQRGYFKTFGRNLLYSILEGQKIEENQKFNLSFYLGPKSVNEMDAVDPRLEELLSFGWFSWICRLLLKILSWFYELVGNYGLSIILLSILIKIPFVPFSIYSRYKLDNYNKYDYQIKAIRSKYKNNLTLMNSELASFHREHNLSAATPFFGCLPLLLQAPILFSIYRVVANYLPLYQAPFFGWIVDLSSKDPYYILPILMGVAGILQHQLSPAAGGDDKTKNMMLLMPVFMVFLFMNFPAGVVLYWLTNNVVAIGEDLIRKKLF